MFSSYVLITIFLTTGSQAAAGSSSPAVQNLNCEAYRNASSSCIAYVTSTAKDTPTVVPATCCVDLKNYQSKLKSTDDKKTACVCSASLWVNSPRVNKARLHKLSDDCKFKFPKSASECNNKK
ncbi:hypothetical protein LINPERPRIM_LOCUS34340 [Linum perenne]